MKLINKLLYNLKEKEVKEAISRNLEEKTENFSIEQVKNLKRVYETEEPTEVNKAFIEELERIIKRKEKLALIKWK